MEIIPVPEVEKTLKSWKKKQKFKPKKHISKPKMPARIKKNPRTRTRKLR